MTGFGTGRDVCREGVSVNQLPADLEVGFGGFYLGDTSLLDIQIFYKQLFRPE